MLQVRFSGEHWLAPAAAQSMSRCIAEAGTDLIINEAGRTWARHARSSFDSGCGQYRVLWAGAGSNSDLRVYRFRPSYGDGTSASPLSRGGPGGILTWTYTVRVV